MHAVQILEPHQYGLCRAVSYKHLSVVAPNSGSSPPKIGSPQEVQFLETTSTNSKRKIYMLHYGALDRAFYIYIYTYAQFF